MVAPAIDVHVHLELRQAGPFGGDVFLVDLDFNVAGGGLVPSDPVGVDAGVSERRKIVGVLLEV